MSLDHSGVSGVRVARMQSVRVVGCLLDSAFRILKDTSSKQQPFGCSHVLVFFPLYRNGPSRRYCLTFTVDITLFAHITTRILTFNEQFCLLQPCTSEPPQNPVIQNKINYTTQFELYYFNLIF